MAPSRRVSFGINCPVSQLIGAQDVPIILNLLEAAAIEQNVPDGVTATEADLIATIEFEEPASLDSAASSTQQRRIATPGKALVVVSPDDKIAGVAVYFISYAAWKGKPGMYLEDLYVLPEYRRQGCARLLLQALAREGERLDCARMEWLCYKDNHRALNFYHGLGAREMDVVTPLRLDRQAMIELANEKPN